MRRKARKDESQKTVEYNLRAQGFQVFDLSPMGGGVPDILAYHKRIGLILIECKNKGWTVKDFTDDQLSFIIHYLGYVDITHNGIDLGNVTREQAMQELARRKKPIIKRKAK